MNVIFEKLAFKNYKDFYKRCVEIKEEYDIFYQNEAVVKRSQEVLKYREYIYSKDTLNELEKNTIWDYLNGYLGREYIRSKYVLPSEKFIKHKK